MREKSGTKKAEGRYHHSALRQALMDAAISFLETNDITQLGMQTLARATGVSKGAPYHHFSNKEAVIVAIAEEGFRLFGAQLEAIGRGATVGSASAVGELVAACLDFAAQHPVHYRLMFLPEWSERSRFPDLHRAGEAALGQLVELVRRAGDLPPLEALQKALSVFALLHGFTSLVAAKVVTSIPGAPPIAQQRAQIEAAVRAIIGGDP